MRILLASFGSLALMLATAAPAHAQMCAAGSKWVRTCGPPGTDKAVVTAGQLGLAFGTGCTPLLSLVATAGAMIPVKRAAPTATSVRCPNKPGVTGTIQTEIVSLRLSGSGGTLSIGTGSPISIKPTLGCITENRTDDATGDGFFDVFFQLRLSSGATYYNRTAVKLRSSLKGFPGTATFTVPTGGGCIPLFTTPATGGVRAATLVNPTLTVRFPGVIAVKLLDLSATRSDGGVRVAWATASELSCGAFSLARCDKAKCTDRDYRPLDALDKTPCRDSPSGATYAMFDHTARGSGAYSYILREHETSGRTNDYGPVSLTAGVTKVSWKKAAADEDVAAPLSPGTGCAVAGDRDAPAGAWLLALGALVLLRRRRR